VAVRGRRSVTLALAPTATQARRLARSR